ncbi:MAG: right-handed parallel beta-helix repeat-containing protein [Actinomycetota bacterium]|nr:right-handed parallel beta-helix repeat-containing protein [Actinomycetota bacterium]
MRTPNRTRLTAVRLLAVSLVGAVVPFAVAGAVRADSTTVPTRGPTAPPAQICGNTTMLAGPTAPPPDSVRVDPGADLNAVTQAQPPGTTFWMAPGTYTLGTDQYSQVIPKDNDTYIGAPGAVIDGQGVNRFAFTQHAANVTIRYLTIQNFGTAGANYNEGVVNHDGGSGWRIEYTTIQFNAGAGVFMGSNGVVSYSCLRSNGQYGFSMYKPDLGGLNTITIDHNEIAANNTYDWEAKIPGCGCSGGGKFWDAHNVKVASNWVHDNRGVGLWADTNNYGFVFDGNYIANNDAEGIFVELSYNTLITNNTLTGNAIVKGKVFAARNDNFPIAAIYVSESGGDARVNGGVNPSLDIVGNTLTDNWGGVVLWENSDRFCGNGFSTAYCTLVNPAAVNLSTCTQANMNSAPYYSDCRWKTQNVNVSNNTLAFHKAAVGCATTSCGQQALLANYGSYPTWSPYKATVVQDAITYHQNNRFAANSYVGDWVFTAYETGRSLTFAEWQAAPYGQDAGSSGDGVSAPPTTTTQPSPTTTTVVSPPTILNAGTSDLEDSIGLWVPWYSSSISQSATQAHSGTSSLRVDVTAPWGWGVQLNAWPGLPATPGNKTISFWGLSSAAANLSASLRVAWLDVSGTPLRTDLVTIASLGSTWQQAILSTVAPAGTVMMSAHLVGTTATAGQTMYFDDFSVVSH